MRLRKGREPTPRMAFGCLAVMVVAAVAGSAAFVVFLWDVNLPI